MWSRRALSLVVVVTLVVSATAPLVAASPRPTPVCGVCSERVLSSSAASYDLSLSVESSTADVELTDEAAARWTVHVRLSGAGVERLRDDPALTTDLVEEALFRDAVAVSAQVEGDTLVARYRTTDFATRVNGAYRLDGLRDDAGAVAYTGLGADRLTIRGPTGTTPAIVPSTATVDGRRVTLTEWSGGWVVFASGPVAPLVAALAVLDAVGSLLLTNAVGYLLIPSLAFLGGLAAILRVTGEADAQSRTSDRLARLVAGLGLLGLLHPLLTGVQPLVNDYTPALIAGGVAALVVAAVGTVRDRLTPPAAIATELGAFAAGVLVVFALSVVGVGPLYPTGGLGGAFRVSLLALPVVCCFAVGVAGTAGRRAGFGVALAAFALLAVSAFEFTSSSMFGVFDYLLALGGAVVIVVLGVPFALLGRRLSA